MGLKRVIPWCLAVLAFLWHAGAQTAELCAESPAAATAGEALIARWPADDEEIEPFEGQVLALPTAANAGEGPFSVSVWINPSDLAGGDVTYGRGIARSTRGEQVGDWVLSVHRDGRLRFYNWRVAGNDPSGSRVTKEAVIAPDAWHHVVATWDGTQSRLFIGGSEAEHSSGETATGWGTGHEVGRSWTEPGYYWFGEIANLRVVGRALPPAEILAASKVGPPARVSPVVLPAGDAAVSAAVDREIEARLQAERVEPAPPTSDMSFIRRVTLELNGRIATAAEIEAFVADAAPDKRQRLIDMLLAGREMPLYWSQIASGWLMPPAARRDEKFLGYLRQSLRKNKPWEQVVRDLLAGDDGAATENAKQFLIVRKDGLKDNSLARDVAQSLLGANLRCAQCHDHPHVPVWTHDRFLGLAAFFARSFEHSYKVGGEQRMAIGERDSGELEVAAPDGSKRVVSPAFLDGKPLSEPMPGTANAKPTADAPPPAPAYSRRAALAVAALHPGSPNLKRALVNRVWRQLMGRGLVEPVDMLYDGNPATHPALLDFLADDFASHGFDLRRLIAVITQSQAYARSSQWTSGDLPDERLYAVAIPRPLDADQLALSLPIALGPLEQPPAQPARSSRARPRPAAWPELLAEFPAPTAEFEPTAQQALYLLNSQALQKRIAADGGLAASLANLDDSQAAQTAFRAVLSRPPTPGEQQQVAALLAGRQGESRLAACRDLVWALAASAEFRFNH